MPKDQQEKTFTAASREGLWVFVPISHGVMFQVNQEGNLTSDSCDNKLLEQMLHKGVTLTDLARHIRLHQKIRIDNETF